jgi:hypothetical protein
MFYFQYIIKLLMKRRLLVLLLFTFVLGSTYAQRQVNGKVTSADDGSPLPGVNVVVVGSQQGSITDIDGNYTISVAEGTTLKFSYIGYLDQEIQVGNQSVIDVSMETDVTQLSEVVVTAFGIEKEKKSLGYAVQRVDGEELTAVKGSPSAVSNLKGELQVLISPNQAQDRVQEFGSLLEETTRSHKVINLYLLWMVFLWIIPIRMKAEAFIIVEMQVLGFLI